MSTSQHMRRIMKIENWPAADRARWASLFVRGGPLDRDGPRVGWCGCTRTTFAESYGRWLMYLARIDQLDPDLAPCARITGERVRLYIDHLDESVTSVTLAELPPDFLDTDLSNRRHS